MAGKCRMAGRFRVEKTGADLIVLCVHDAGHRDDHADYGGRTWPQTTEVGERAASDLDLDAIRARTDAVHRENQLAGPDHAITTLVCDAWALLAEVERLRALQRPPLWMCEGGEMTVYHDVDALLARRRPGDPTQPAATSPVADDVARTDPAEGHAPPVGVAEAHAPSEGVAGQHAYEVLADGSAFRPRAVASSERTAEIIATAASWYGQRLNPDTDEAEQS